MAVLPYLGGKYTRAVGGRTVMAGWSQRGVPICYFVCRAGTSFAASGTTFISNSLGQSLPVTKSRSCAAMTNLFARFFRFIDGLGIVTGPRAVETHPRFHSKRQMISVRSCKEIT